MTKTLAASVLVGLGGMAGSVSRYGVSLLFRRFSATWPGGTLAVNLLGCFLIGAITALSERTEAVSPATRLLVATGFCGGFTTMSSMVYETSQMARSGEYFFGALYLGLSVVGSLLAFYLGAIGVRLVVHHAGGSWN